MHSLFNFFAEHIMIMSYSLPRIIFVFMFSGFIGRNVVSGFIRASIILSINIFAYPITAMQILGNGKISIFIWLLIILKESILGAILGLLSSMGVWIFSIMGSVIDNHRGASFATINNPFNDNEDSLLSTFFAQLIVVIFFTQGLFLNFLKIVYHSFILWPIFTFWPNIDINFAQVITQILVYIFATAITFSAPVILLMLVSEIGLAITNRFVPQMQVFFLSMPIKSGIAFFVLLLYFWFLIELSGDFINSYQEILSKINYYFHTLS